MGRYRHPDPEVNRALGLDPVKGAGAVKRRRRTRAVDRSTPGCGCLRCQKAREKFRGAAAGTTRDPALPPPNNNMGRVQHAGPDWADGGADHPKEGRYFGHLRPMEMADRLHREAYGKPLVAAYRYMIGPTPILAAGDTKGARAFLTRIEVAIEHGEWTRSEWARLHRMRDKWRARASGGDCRFAVVGNRTGGLDRATQAQVTHRELVARMLEALRRSALGSRGD